MADPLVELDEAIEKAGKVGFRGATVSRAQRRRSALGLDGSLPAKRSNGLRGFDGVKQLPSGKDKGWRRPGEPTLSRRGWRNVHEKINTLGRKDGGGRATREHGAWLQRHGKVRKSADETSPLEALDSAIEKAKPLLARGKDGVRRGTIGGVKVSLGRSGKSNGGARTFRAGSKVAYLDKPSKYAGNNSGRNETRRTIKRHLASLKAGK